MRRRSRAGIIAFVALAAALWLAVWSAFCAPAQARGEAPRSRGARARAALALAAACRDHEKPAPAPKPEPPDCPCNAHSYGRCICPDGRCCCPHCAAVPGRKLPPVDFELPWQLHTPYSVPAYFPAPRPLGMQPSPVWGGGGVGRGGGGFRSGGC